MSEPDRPPSGTGSKVLSIAMIVVGGLLLLPGICAGFFAFKSIGYPRDPYLYEWRRLWLACFAIAAAGIALIVWAARRLRW